MNIATLWKLFKAFREIVYLLSDFLRSIPETPKLLYSAMTDKKYRREARQMARDEEKNKIHSFTAYS